MGPITALYYGLENDSGEVFLTQTEIRKYDRGDAIQIDTLKAAAFKDALEKNFDKEVSGPSTCFLNSAMKAVHIQI